MNGSVLFQLELDCLLNLSYGIETNILLAKYWKVQIPCMTICVNC